MNLGLMACSQDILDTRQGCTIIFTSLCCKYVRNKMIKMNNCSRGRLIYYTWKPKNVNKPKDFFQYIRIIQPLISSRLNAIIHKQALRITCHWLLCVEIPIASLTWSRCGLSSSLILHIIKNYLTYISLCDVF